METQPNPMPPQGTDDPNQHVQRSDEVGEREDHIAAEDRSGVISTPDSANGGKTDEDRASFQREIGPHLPQEPRPKPQGKYCDVEGCLIKTAAAPPQGTEWQLYRKLLNGGTGNPSPPTNATPTSPSPEPQSGKRRSKPGPKNPFAPYWETEIVPRLEQDLCSERTASGILNVLIDKYPGKFDLEKPKKFKNLRDTLRRLIKPWREDNGRPASRPEKCASKSKASKGISKSKASKGANKPEGKSRPRKRESLPLPGFKDFFGKSLPRRPQWKQVVFSSARVIYSRLQKTKPGEDAQVDFTHLDGLGITLRGEPAPLLLFMLRLRYSRWTYAKVFGGEDLPALLEGLQNALWELGGVPRWLWRDRNGSSVWNDKPVPPFDLVIEHYGPNLLLIPQGRPWINGGVERGNGVIKPNIEQILLERGSRDFASRQDIQDVVRRAVNWSNRKPEVQRKLAEERNRLNPLPQGRMPNHKDVNAKVDKFGLIRLYGCIYSVPESVRGNVHVRMYDDRVEVYRENPDDPLSQQSGPMVTWPRLHVKCSVQIDHRHLLPRIAGNPIGLGGLPKEYREAMFPRASFKRTYRQLKIWCARGAYRTMRRPDTLSGMWISDGHAEYEYLCILALATDSDREKEVDQALQQLLKNGQPFYYEDVERLMPSPPAAEHRWTVQRLIS